MILRVTGDRGAITYATVSMPAGEVTVSVPNDELPTGCKPSTKNVSVVADGDTYSVR